MSEFAIFIEGGGGSRREQGPLRGGFQSLLKPILEAARVKNIRHRVILCGGRSETIRLFLNERRLSPEVTSFLLVDSEEIPKTDTNARSYLAARDEPSLSNVPEALLHMMTTVMETWIVSDAQQLKKYFGQGFKDTALPMQANLEGVSKNDVCDKLEQATRNSQKGRYHKQKHGPDLVAGLDHRILRQRCPRFTQLIESLEVFVQQA